MPFPWFKVPPPAKGARCHIHVLQAPTAMSVRAQTMQCKVEFKVMAVVGTIPRAPQLSSCGQRLHSPPDSLQSPVLKEHEQERVPEKYQPLRHVMTHVWPR